MRFSAGAAFPDLQRAQVHAYRHRRLGRGVCGHGHVAFSPSGLDEQVISDPCGHALAKGTHRQPTDLLANLVLACCYGHGFNLRSNNRTLQTRRVPTSSTTSTADGWHSGLTTP